MLDAFDDDWLLAWYRLWCDGDWEHQYGVTIATSQTGWSFKADLVDTPYQGVGWAGEQLHRSDEDWIEASASPEAFAATGGIWNLEESLNVFRQWVQGFEPTFPKLESPNHFLARLAAESGEGNDGLAKPSLRGLERLVRDSGETMQSRIRITLQTMDNPGWMLQAFPAPGEPLSAWTLEVGHSDLSNGWLEWRTDGHGLIAGCGLWNLPDLIGKLVAVCGG